MEGYPNSGRSSLKGSRRSAIPESVPAPTVAHFVVSKARPDPEGPSPVNSDADTGQ